MLLRDFPSPLQSTAARCTHLSPTTESAQPDTLCTMAPRFKRQRRDSHQSSHPSSLQSQGSHRVRFRRPSLTSQTVPQRNQRRSSQSQAGPRPQAPQEGYAASPARVHHVEDDEDVDEDLEQIVMAIDRHQKGAVGCAYYVAREEKLYCLQDVTNGSSDAIETCEFTEV